LKQFIFDTEETMGDGITLSWDRLDGVADLELFDMVGRKIKETDMDRNNYYWRMENLPSGLYMLKATNNGVKYMLPILIID